MYVILRTRMDAFFVDAAFAFLPTEADGLSRRSFAAGKLGPL
jgi:hypothetical protein